MIESKLRDVATYAHEGVAFDNLQLINFIYGGNGCGKTTLSRLLASTEPEKEYPTCEIKWTTKPIQTLVYNKDFRDRNLSENIPGVFTLGEQRVEAMQEMDRMRQEAEASEQMAERLARRMAECEDQKNGQMARLRDRLWQNVFKPNELFKDCLRGYITKGKFTNRLVELKHQHVDDVPQRVLGYCVEDWALCLKQLTDEEAAKVHEVKGESTWSRFADTLTTIALHRLGLPKEWFSPKEVERAETVVAEEEQRVWTDIIGGSHTHHGRNKGHRRLIIARRLMQNQWKFKAFADESAGRFLWKEFVGWCKG